MALAQRRLVALTESKAKPVKLSADQAVALRELGKRMASDRRWWGDNDEEPGATADEVRMAVPAVLLATAAFSGLGLLMAGALRAEVTLAAANGLYLLMLLLGGMLFPLSKLPTGLRDVARALPAGALSDALHGALTAGASVPTRAWVVLAVWAVAAPLLASRLFRWE